MTAIACFVAVVLVTVGFTAVAARRTRSADDFYVAGGRIGGFQNGLAIAGDFMSAATILGMSAIIFSELLSRCSVVSPICSKIRPKSSSAMPIRSGARNGT